MAALTTLNITEKNANNSLSVTVKVNVTKEGVFTTNLSKEDVDKIHSYGIKLPTNRLGNEGYWSHLKKMISGTHFWVSRKHLQRYVDCESFRYNTKHLSESERFDVFLQNTKRRLRYSQIN